MAEGGWLNKKGKNRWFFVKGNIIYWFTGEQDPSANLASACRGSLNLDNCSVLIHPTKKLCFQIDAPTTTYVMKAKNDADVQMWFSFLSETIKNSQKRLEKMGKLSKSGWLEKKGLRRYFVLKGYRFYWYTSENSGTEKGSLDLTYSTCGPVVDDSYFVLGAAYIGKEYKIVCPNGVHEARAWVKALTNAIELGKKAMNKRTAMLDVSDGDIKHEGWLDKKGKKRYFTLENELLSWYEKNPSEKQSKVLGNLNLAGCEVSRNGFQFSIKPLRRNIYTLKAKTEEVSREWVIKIASVVQRYNYQQAARGGHESVILISAGWVNKKYIGQSKVHKRFLRISQDMCLNYYDSENEDSTPKGTINLLDCAVSRAGPNTFNIASSSGRSYPFECENGSLCTQWINSVQSFIYRASAVWKSSGIRNVGYMIKKGDNRWFALKDGVLYWFNSIQKLADVTPSNSNGSLEILGCSVEPVHGKAYTFNLKPPQGKSYVLTARGENEFNEWMGSLKSVINKERPQGLVFGVPLPDLLAREGSVIPQIVEQCVATLAERGIETQGIFRISGQANLIQEFIDSWDQGNYIPMNNAEVHVISSLLKQWIREIPEPLCTWDLYENFVSSNSNQEIANALKLLPDENYNVIEYLVGFLHEMSHHSEVTSMTVGNIAIVFGPNILKKRGGEDGLSSLVETPRILNCTEKMIKYYHEIFSGAGDPEIPSDIPPPVLAPNDLPPPVLPPQDEPMPSNEPNDPSPQVRVSTNQPPEGAFVLPPIESNENEENILVLPDETGTNEEPEEVNLLNLPPPGAAVITLPTNIPPANIVQNTETAACDTNEIEVNEEPEEVNLLNLPPPGASVITLPTNIPPANLVQNTETTTCDTDEIEVNDEPEEINLLSLPPPGAAVTPLPTNIPPANFPPVQSTNKPTNETGTRGTFTVGGNRGPSIDIGTRGTFTVGGNRNSPRTEQTNKPATTEPETVTAEPETVTTSDSVQTGSSTPTENTQNTAATEESPRRGLFTMGSRRGRG
eukprot:TRINITY_DN1027_c0_g1_i1.p1 TRINITY_DN1027_c0_g1~~TRINITY_DN1027_c0_g1_i1.p1  ORF type:complete len:1018 (+),score=268.61 TRINITY_DN1027_c0_g1_i1:27-3080(+)